MPKVTLVSQLTVLLHEGRLKVHRDLPEGATLGQELRDFRANYSDAGHLQFSARSGRHDDLLLACAMCAWYLADNGMPGRGIYDYVARMAGRGGDLAERYCVGVDLGQSNDPTAVCVMSRVELPGRSDEVFEAVA